MTYLEWKEKYRQERLKTNEIWKDIPCFEGLYQASTLGNIRSLDRVVVSVNKYGEYNKHLKGKDKSFNLHTSGYFMCILCKEGRQKTWLIHQLIAMTFLNHKPNAHQLIVDHIDNNPLNNKIDNLQIITVRKNSSKDKFRKNITSKYTGVSWYKSISKWKAQINIKNKVIHLGYFYTEKEASEAYQKALQFDNQHVVC